MKSTLLLIIIHFSLLLSNLDAQTTTTTTSLTDPKQIEQFLDATSRLRCICLPSLPIQSCSYNMCIVSSYLKTFIENQIKQGMTSDEIVYKFENGFGDTIQDDSVVKHFKEEGNDRMIQSLMQGFGPNIQAKPDSTWINLSLAFIGLIGLVGIGYYLIQRKKASPSKDEPGILKSSDKEVPKSLINQTKLDAESVEQDALTKKYLSEL